MWLCRCSISFFFGVKVAVAFIGYGFTRYLRKRGADQTSLRSFQGVLLVIRLVVWSGAVIFFLDNLGFKVSALIAGLGVGGVAVALAAQSIFKDLFSYFFILFDRPFKVGDFIVLDDYMGAIEHMGLKTTRLRSLTGEMLIFPNSQLTDSRLRNYRLMQKRRVEFKINVEYQTSLGQLQDIPKIIAQVITPIKDASLERAHLSTFGDYGLTYQVAYYVLTDDYNKYMDIQQQINFAIIEEFAKRDLHFAYPGKLCLLGENKKNF
jgi:small-conductance mechanosensitive channel